MRLFWKLFCSMVLITTFACAVGGYVLIDSQFRSSLAREVSALYEENDLLRYALSQELEDQLITEEADLVRLAEDIRITTAGGAIAFRISRADGTALARGGSLSVDAAALTDSLSDHQRGWLLQKTSAGRRCLHAASPLFFGAERLYLENCRDVTSLFTQRQSQYRSFSYLMGLLIAVVGALSFAVSHWMLRPLARLSAATKRMAGGELTHRVPVTGRDELSLLSEDFNAMAAQLESQVHQLKDAARAQEDFIASFTHEIKTPLTSIIGYADLLRSRSLPPETARESADYIFAQGRRLESLSGKLLNLIVLEKQDLALRPVALAPWLHRVAGALSLPLEKQGIRLRIRAEVAEVDLESDLMETVLLNLLDNARKAIEGEGLIVVEGLWAGEDYLIRVVDSGKGIPAQELSRVTEPFYMVDKSRARAQGGAGLGLALCRRILDLHGGALEVKSQEGRGTEITLRLKGGEKA